MGGDGMGAMALLVGAAVVGGPVAVAILFFWSGRSLSRRRGATAAGAWRIGVIAGALGGLLGGAATIATVRPDIWMPDPEIRLALQEGSDPAWIVLLESPASDRSLRWRGWPMPFRGVNTTLNVPANGIVRVRSLDRIGRGARIVWPDGAGPVSTHRGPAPRGIGANSFAAWSRHPGAEARDDIPLDEPGLLAWFRRRGIPEGQASDAGAGSSSPPGRIRSGG